MFLKESLSICVSSRGKVTGHYLASRSSECRAGKSSAATSQTRGDRRWVRPLPRAEGVLTLMAVHPSWVRIFLFHSLRYPQLLLFSFPAFLLGSKDLLFQCIHSETLSSFLNSEYQLTGIAYLVIKQKTQLSNQWWRLVKIAVLKLTIFIP